ncbi:MAG: YndJ family protein [Saprospiraceae bacterium]|nr:YndJ family protein [Saprospiraceae bacterium]
MKTNTYFTLLGLGAGIFTVLLFPDSPKELNWVKIILLLAPTLLIPIWLRSQFAIQKFIFPASAWSLGLAFLLAQGWVAGMLAVPWLMTTLWLAYTGLLNKHQLPSAPATWSGRAAFLFLPVGAAWAVADRLGWQPLGFQATIVLLTAVHFHYAGFLLLGIAERLLQSTTARWYKGLDLSLVLGVPLVAIGITMTDLDGPPWVETFAATVMAGSGIALAVAHVALAIRHTDKLTAGFWLIGSICLLAGMILAIAYGWRTYYPLDFLNIPWMYAVHGSLNFLGVGVFLLIGWVRTAPKSQS